jgi:hypothetical protein
MRGAAERRARDPFSRARERDPFSRAREKAPAKPTDEGLASRARTSLALTPTLSRTRERGRGSAP